MAFVGVGRAHADKNGRTAGREQPCPVAKQWARELADASPWTPPPVTTVVVAAHPDDEVLATGGIIGHQSDHGIDVHLVAATDGEAAYDSLPRAFDIGALRRAEQERAMAALGVARSRVRRVGLPDGQVSGHENALADAIVEECRRTGCELLVAPWLFDDHPDHEACGRAAAAAAATLRIDLVYGLFWVWHRGPVDAFADCRLLRLEMSDVQVRRRAGALTHHRSQLTTDIVAVPMLSSADAEPICWPAEYYVAGPVR